MYNADEMARVKSFTDGSGEEPQSMAARAGTQGKGVLCGSCRVCTVSVPVDQLRAQGGCCDMHIDAPHSATGQGCAECGALDHRTSYCPEMFT